MANNYQLAVIGSGSGGREAVRLAARKGLRAVLIERDGLGGTCFRNGCYAVRILQAYARQYRDSWKSGRFGHQANLLKATLLDWITAQRMVSSRLADKLAGELERSSIELVRGHGELLDDTTVQVTGTRGLRKTITADHIIIATGSRPGSERDFKFRVLNSDEIFEHTALLERLAIVGAGYVGCEFASIYRTLGCEVTLFEKGDRLLTGWDAEVGKRLTEQLALRGVDLALNCSVDLDRIDADESGVIIRDVARGSLEFDAVLLATGRKPNTEGLGLQALGIDDRGFLHVDATMRIAKSELYAIGDVAGVGAFDSTAFSQANAAVQSILGVETRFDPRGVPRCAHTDPAIATVGWTEEQAIENGVAYLAAANSFRLISDSDRSVVDPEPIFIKVLIDPADRRLLGCVAVGDQAPAVVNTASVAIRGGLTVEQLSEAPLAQPTALEALVTLLRQLG
jgi:glutathione reductase (NADPH)